MFERLVKDWVYGGFLAALTLIFLAPLFSASWPEALRLTFLFLPIYMLHQYEEHDADRFRLFFNQTIGNGKEVLTPFAVFMINIPCVWGVIVLACYLCAYVSPGLGLIAIYLAVVNAIVHVAHALIFRCYNPGLASAILLFLPFGVYAILRFDAMGAGGATAHAVGLGIAIILHAMIIVHAVRRRAMLELRAA